MQPASAAPGGDGQAQGDPNMTDDAYRGMVATFKEHIFAGDIFQGVPSRRVSFPAPEGGYPIYRRLRVSNPAPYMFYVRMLGMELAGSSPEPLVRVEGRQVSSRPIAGTRPRGQTEVRDRMLEHELLADPKEQAEHAMLVDLARNDLGRVCTAGSVTPTQLMEVERFTKVMHIVSTVEGELREELHPLDALAVTFPAGTLTGAPKRRAMELIAAQRTHAARSLRRRGGLRDVRRRSGLLHHDPHGGRGGGARHGADGRRGGGRLRSSDRAGGNEGQGRGAPARGGARRYHAARGRGDAPMILVVDHYDSFTYNLVQLIESLGHAHRGREERRRAGGGARGPRAGRRDPVPGPGRPEDAGCFTALLEVLPPQTPVLGVCLGHQAIGVEYGGTVDRTTPVHGKASLVFHEGRGSWRDSAPRSRRAATTRWWWSARICPRSWS